MGNRLEDALRSNRDEIQAGIDEAESELKDIRERAGQLEQLIERGRLMLEGGTAVMAVGPNGARITLHEAIRRVLKERGNVPATARELADEVNTRDLYRKRDGSPVEINQIHARVNNYQSMFEKVGNKIRLREA